LKCGWRCLVSGDEMWSWLLREAHGHVPMIAWSYFCPSEIVDTADSAKESVMKPRSRRQRVLLAVLCVAGLGLSTDAFADDHVRGVVSARGDDGTVTILADDSSSLLVVLDDDTKVKRSDGRDMEMSSSLLVPGLRVRVEGEYLGRNRFVAECVEFSRTDLKMALGIKMGVDSTDRSSLENQRRIAFRAKPGHK
jgi:hypothetical protein